jgi:hypothetical protein
MHSPTSAWMVRAERPTPERARPRRLGAGTFFREKLRPSLAPCVLPNRAGCRSAARVRAARFAVRARNQPGKLTACAEERAKDPMRDVQNLDHAGETLPCGRRTAAGSPDAPVPWTDKVMQVTRRKELGPRKKNNAQ